MTDQRCSRSHRQWLPAWDGTVRESRFKGGATTTATIPSELKPLINASVAGVTGLQPGAMEFFNTYADQIRQGTGARNLQIAPMTGIETSLYNLGQSGTDFLGQVAPAFYKTAQTMDLGSPLTDLAATGVDTPAAEDLLQYVWQRGFDTLDTPIAPSLAQQEFYNNLMGGMDLLGQRAGTTTQEQSATSALNSLTGIAGQPLTTPAAEQQALAQIATLTGGPLGSSPATREAIAAMEREYETNALPAMQNQLAQAGLGRSGALEQGIADLRGKLFAAEVPLLQQEIATREQTLPILQDIAKAQTGRQSGSIDRILQALNAQASGMTALGGQIASRSQADVARDLQARLNASPQLLEQQKLETEAQTSPIERELAYIQSQFAPAVQIAQQQTARSQLPIDRQIQTALQSANVWNAMAPTQIDFAKLMGEIGSLPRQQQQAENEAANAGDLRAQALAESLLMGPLDVLPSLIGTSMKGGGGGLFGS